MSFVNLGGTQLGPAASVVGNGTLLPPGATTLGSPPACTGAPGDKIALTSLKKSEDFCSRNYSSGGYLFDVEHTDHKVFILDGLNGTAEHLLAPEQCATLSTMSAGKGIMLEDLDSDLMGADLSGLSANASKVERLMYAFSKQSDTMDRAMLEKFDDLNRTAEAVASGDLSRGSSEVLHTSVKWIKGAVLASQVESCLCCDEEEVAADAHMADHCKVAYTLGGQNSSNPFAYTFKVTAGTFYQVTQQAGNWVVPFVGKSLVRGSNRAACQYACDMRMPHLFEAYAHGNVRNVPGVAMKSWVLTAAANGVQTLQDAVQPDVR